MKKTKNILKSIVLTVFLLSWTFAPWLTTASLIGNTNNATFTFAPSSGTYKVNSNFTVDIFVNTHGQNVVVVAAHLSFSSSLFNVVSIDTSGSVFTTEAENVIDNTNGKVKITRGIPTPGVNTTSGKVATLTIRGLTNTAPSSDNFNFDFTSGSTIESNIILNDGLGTDILSGVYNARFTLDGTPPANVSNFTATPGGGQISLSWTNPTTDFSGVRILRKTASYPTDYNDGAVAYDNNGTSYLDTGLSNGTTYYYRAFSRDAVLNYSSGVQVSASPQDGIAPGQITTLSATAVNSSSIRLNWTAVGDDGSSGTAASYDIRHSTAAITSGNFSSATQVSGEPAPKVSGNAETMTVSSLSSNTIYYFAIKAIDESNNNSPLSNVVSARTSKTSDLNNDGIVNSVDFGILMSYWNYTSRPTADINQDGIVNSVDFGIMMSQWG
jgi:hypothetical protein